MLTRFFQWINTRRKLVWLALFALVLAAVAIVLTPVFQIMPFKAQTPRIMSVAYVMRRWSPVLTVVASLVVVTFAIALWPRGRWWSRIVLVIVLLPVFAATWLAQQNHFEWMFNPLPNPAYIKSSEAGFIDDADRVMAVTLGAESVAYPIRIMAYHHVVADTVGGTPIVATY